MTRQQLRFAVAAFFVFAFISGTASAGIKNLFHSSSKQEEGELSRHFKGRLAAPRMDLPRGTLMLQGGVVDFAEMERQIALNGTGPRKGGAVSLDEVEVWSDKIRVLLREPGRKPDPRGLAIVLKAERKGNFDKFRTVEGLEGVLEQMLDFSESARVSSAPVHEAPAAVAPVAASSGTQAPVRPAVRETLGFSIGSRKAAVFENLGEPLKREAGFEGEDVVERWFYEFSDMSSLLVVLRNGTVESLKKF